MAVSHCSDGGSVPDTSATEALTSGRASGVPRRMSGRGRVARRAADRSTGEVAGEAATPPAGVVVRTVGLTRRFDHLMAVDHLDLGICHGEVFGLLGRNGAGKTTTIKMLITLLAPTEGTASVGGYDIRTEPELVRRVIGYVPQLVSADGSLTASENLMVFARIYHIPGAQRKARVREALSFMELDRAAHTLVRDFSGGMIRRLEIGQSMLHRPAVLFLDEPTVGLDPAARREVWDQLRRLIQLEGTTLVLTTHDMEEADALCDRVAIMNHGRIVTAGTPAGLAAPLGPDATLDDVFIAACGDQPETEVGFADVARTRSTASRLG